MSSSITVLSVNEMSLERIIPQMELRDWFEHRGTDPKYVYTKFVVVQVSTFRFGVIQFVFHNTTTKEDFICNSFNGKVEYLRKLCLPVSN